MTDMRLWDFLSNEPQKKHRHSRTQALCDLINKQIYAILKNDNDYIAASITDFAKAWGWDRMTVTKFFEKLEEINVLTTKTTANRRIVRMNLLRDDQS